MKVLIIGNLGYIGPMVVKHFRTTYPGSFLAGYDIGYFIQSNTYNGIAGDTLLNVQHYGDVRNFDEQLLSGIDAVIYLAAISNDPMGNAYETPTLDINYHAAISIAEKAKKNGVNHFVFASSCSVYGFADTAPRTETSETNPLTAYAKSKVFAEKFKNYGIFYPLQTFTKNAIVDFNIIPFFILGSNEGVEKKLIDLAKIISNNVEIMDDVKRQKLHISAILVNNFVNHLFALSEQYCIENDLNFDLLKPLIGSTFNKVSNNISPTIVQTGPAKRGDLGTIMEHLEIIKTSKIKHLESIYTLLTASIIDLYKEKKDELPI